VSYRHLKEGVLLKYPLVGILVLIASRHASAATAGSKPDKNRLASIVNKTQFSRMMDGKLADPKATLQPLYASYEQFVIAGATFPEFCGTFDVAMRRRECAAAFANWQHESGRGVYAREINPPPGWYCDKTTKCPGNGDKICEPGKEYFGRGAVQLSWNANYCKVGAYLGINLHADPDLAMSDPTTMWKIAMWYWMTQPGPAVTGWPEEPAHDAIVLGHGFGGAIRAINGSVECSGGNKAQVLARIKYFEETKAILDATSLGPDGC
jgi:Chitinase class I